MTSLTLYRGLQVPIGEAERVSAAIRGLGLAGDEGDWQTKVPRIEGIRSQLDVLFAHPEQIPGDLLHVGPHAGVYAGGTARTAEHYACRHGSQTGMVPLVVKFSAPISNVFVDGRDFLYTAFQLWDRDGVVGRAKQRQRLADLYGPAVLRYFDAAAESDETPRRVALCNLAAFDPEVVKAHYHNQSVILGRHRTRFASAFVVKCPVPAKDIVSIWTPEHSPLEGAAVSLDEFVSLGR